MRQKKWKERIGGNPGLIIIGAFIILSVILSADHLFNLPQFLSGAPPEQFVWEEIVFDIAAIFCIGLISFSLIRKSELKQREMERGLKDSESSYRELAESITDIFFAFNRELRFTYWNKASENLTGISAKDAIGKSLYDIFPMTEETKKVEDGYLEVLRTQKPRNFESQYQIEGKNFCFEISAYPSKDGLSVFVKDITERKQAEEALRESQAKLQSIFSAAPAGIGMTINQTIGELNARLCEITGYSKEELSGKSISIVYPSDQDYLSARSEIYNQLREKGHSTIEASWKRKDGKLISVLLNCALLKPGDFSQGITFTVLDITEREQAEEALRESEEKYRALIEATGRTGEGIIIIQDNGVEEAAFVFVNDEFCKMSGYSQEELLGRSSWDFIPHEISARLRDWYKRRHMGESLPSHYEAAGVHKDGTIVPLELSIVTMPWQGKIATVLYLRDITERKKAEESLRISEKFLNSVIENTPNPMWISDENGTVIRMNQALRDLLRISDDEIVGKYNVLKDTQVKEQGLLPLVTSVFEKGETVEFEIDYITTREEQLQLSREVHKILDIIISPVKDSQGKVINAIAQHKDITEHKKAEEEIRTEKDKLENVTRNIGVGLAIVSKDYRTLWSNDVLKQIFGEVEGKLCYNTYNGRTDICPGCGVREVFEQGKNVSVHEQVGKDKDGNTIWSQIIATPLKDKEGNITAAMEVVVPITERKKAEEEIKNLAKFPSENPDPIMRISKDGIILYANDSSLSLLKEWRTSVNQPVPDYLRQLITEVTNTGLRRNIEIEHKGRILSFIVVPVHGTDYVNFYGRDITERKKAEEALRTSEEKYRAIVENATDQIFTLDRQCRFLSINKTAAEISRKSVSEMVGKSLLQIFPKETAAQFSKNIEEVFETGQSRFIEERMYVRGKEFYNSTTLNPIKDDKRNVIAVTGIVRDITKRKKAEEALRESEERYRVLFESSAEGILVADIETKEFKYANPALCRMLGYTEDELKQMSVADIHSKEELEYVISEFEAQARGEKTLTQDIPCLRKDGTIIYADINTTKVTLDGREYNAGFFKDVTERKRAEEALRESEQRYRGVVDNIGIGVSLISPNLEILFLNKQMKKWFPNVDISKEAICYRAFNSPPREEACSYCPTNKTLQDGQIHESITETPVGGKIINYRVISSPIKDLQGNVIAAIEMVEDITEMKRLQEQLIQTEKLAAVGTLAYGIAHEFNNILAGMMANAELGLITKDSNQIKECLEIIVESSQRASSITNNLLAFARQKEARKELIDLTEPLKSVLSIIRRELEKHNIELIEKFKSIPKIYCDPGQFSEVFLNMITNARDAMHPKGGTLTIQVEPAEEDIRIVFKDNGCGIPEEIKGRIFEPFVTTKGALGRSEVPGTGLGLFLTYGIINGYKGKIEVETKVGKGTKFSIIIPISENQPREPLLDTRIESSKETDKKLKILLVDDEKAITLGLKKFLESKGHKVSISLRAKEGLEIFRKGRFDLVLSDITIPDMDGIELIKKVKEKDQQTKIIVITGHLQKEKEEKAREAGADEVLIKPFKNDLLYQTISKVVD